MKAFLAAVVMLQALITGDCLLCETCLASGTSQCSGIFKQCSPDVTHCVKGLENGTLGGNVILTVFKDCLDPSQQVACGREFQFQNSRYFIQISRTCCDSDFCNKGEVEVPAVDQTPNGYICDECLTQQSSEACTPTGQAHCTGKQNTCSSFYGSALRTGGTLRSYSMKACATQDSCDLYFPVATVFYGYHSQCVPAQKL
ncbi:phospholipase A2 inhibitor and Ly6/PLAUR domain-containing protein-like [Lissotriton helveticus]|uniref:Sodefrin-like factor 2 n=2 Tax=Lissotriton helveticus TaxID=256425 RepID=A0A0B5H3M7_9SALA|nr:sodefrin precursor-like factor 2 [Lissotriton helveticus]